VAVHDSLLGVGRGKEVSARVESTNEVAIVVERPMYFPRYSGRIGEGHIALGAPTPSPTWHFAEGYTGDDVDEYLTLMNPASQDARVRITYYLPRDEPVIKELSAPAQRRTTVAVHDSAHGVGRGKEVSARVEVTNGVGIVAERPIYFPHYKGMIAGGHNAVGATEPATTWLFAEGYTGDGVDEYLTIMNATATDAQIRITYYLNGGAPVAKTLIAPANARTTVAVHETTQGVGPGKEVSAKVESVNKVGIVVERPMYFPRYGGGISGGHNAMGYTP
jgi:hypothetical protein